MFLILLGWFFLGSLDSSRGEVFTIDYWQEVLQDESFLRGFECKLLNIVSYFQFIFGSPPGYFHYMMLYEHIRTLDQETLKNLRTDCLTMVIQELTVTFENVSF